MISFWYAKMSAVKRSIKTMRTDSYIMLKNLEVCI